MTQKINYESIMSDRKLFNETVYTPLSEAIKILEERQKDTSLINKLEKLLNGDIPEPLRKMQKYGISGKQVATPNFDTRWFVKLNNEFGLKTFFLEYHGDKFTSNNPFKHSLGQLIVHKNVNKKGEYEVEKINIIDFNKYNGKAIKDIFTIWGEPLVEFHRNLFKVYNIDTDDFVFFDESEWLKRNGNEAKNYYSNDLLLYICHGILFENFILTGEDGNFVKEVFLPAFKKVFESTGVKPLIVPIPPMDIEEDQLWFSYDVKIKSFIKN